MTHTYKITGMTCDNCAAKVKELLLKIAGVTHIEINRGKNEAYITMEMHVPVSAFKNILSGTKYQIDEDLPLPRNTRDAENETESIFITYKPVFLIFGYLIIVATLVQLNAEVFSASLWMSHFMAGFFLVFSFFNFLDLSAFADSYSNYDIISRRWYTYGFIYPFIEFALGIMYLIPPVHTTANIAALIVMSISSIGVIQNLAKKNPFQCACLGTVFKFPLSKISLIEDLLMAGMSIVMLIMK